MLLFLTVLRKSKTLKRPNLAATVILAREHKEDLQIYLIKRSPMSGFMAGNYVFPGGIIDSEDRYTEVWKGHVDLDLNWISQRLGGDLSGEEVLANGVAAVRETFEEVGVLLAHRDKPVEKDLDRICEMRLASHLLKGWFLEQVVSEGWILEFSRLARWSHWITPPLVRSRFDTRFFVAFMPEGQKCTPDGKEATCGIWIRAEQALASNLSGNIPLSPPTLVTLHQLLKYRTLDQLKREVEARTWGEPQTPHLILTAEGPIMLEPWDPMYNQQVVIDTRNLKNNILPVGEPFSRIWLHKGIWKPIRGD